MCTATTSRRPAEHPPQPDSRANHAPLEPVVGGNDHGDEEGRGTPRLGPAVLVGVAIWLAILFLMIT